MKTKVKIDLSIFSAIGIGFGSLSFASSGNDYADSIEPVSIVKSDSLSDYENENLYNSAAWIYFSISEKLGKRGDFDAIDQEAKSTDALQIIKSSETLKESLLVIKNNPTGLEEYNKLNNDGFFSAKDAIVLSKSIAKWIY